MKNDFITFATSRAIDQAFLLLPGHADLLSAPFHNWVVGEGSTVILEHRDGSTIGTFIYQDGEWVFCLAGREPA